MKSVIIALAWAGAIGWPAAAGLAGLAAPWLRRSRVALALLALASVPWALGVWAVLIEPSILVVREVRAESALWRGAPLRVGIVSDVHVGAHMSPTRVARIAARMNALEPDIVLLAGDFVSGHEHGRPAREIQEIADGLHALGRLEAPLGAYAVLGNHDWWFDGDDVESWLKEAGLVVLENEALSVARGDEELWLVGLADEESERAGPDWRAGLARVPPGADVIAVAHRPDVFMDVPEGVALTVAGHSHCGQINLAPLIPLFPISEGSALWPCGLYEKGGRRLYVTGGLGVSMLPARFRAPPEIVLLTLAPAAPDTG
jgi:predicted MPP superfamily phosphohydrolase